MPLPFTELEAITNDYFLMDGGKATDIYFYTSFLTNYFLKQQKGLWERPPGGRRIRVPLEYDGQESGFYGRGEPLPSDDHESITSAYFDWKHAFGNATVYRLDGLENSGGYEKVQLVVQRVSGAQKSITKTVSGSIYDPPAAGAKRFTGALACCNATTSLAYGAIAEDDLVAADGTKPWKGQITTTVEKIGLNVIRTMATTAKIRDGDGGKPDLFTMPEALWNIISDLLQAQQRFTDSKRAIEAGFTGIRFEGKDLMPDDFCPSGYAFGFNTNFYGAAIHEEGLYLRTPWRVIADSPEDRSMKILLDGNWICSNRKAHIAHSNLS